MKPHIRRLRQECPTPICLNCSILRKTDPGRACFGSHMDITIPYDELGSYDAVTKDGEIIPIIRGGRFVLPGTEELNQALEGLA